MQEINTPFLKFTRAFLEWSRNKDFVTISISTFFDFVKDIGLFDEDKVEKYVEMMRGEIKKGDFVKVIDADKLYPTYIAWVIEHVTDKKQIARFQFGQETLCDINSFEVIEIDDGIAFIEATYDKTCYLMNIEGLERIVYKGGNS